MEEEGSQEQNSQELNWQEQNSQEQNLRDENSQEENLRDESSQQEAMEEEYLQDDNSSIDLNGTEVVIDEEGYVRYYAVNNEEIPEQQAGGDTLDPKSGPLARDDTLQLPASSRPCVMKTLASRQKQIKPTANLSRRVPQKSLPQTNSTARKRATGNTTTLPSSITENRSEGEKRIDALRQKMDNYLTACNNKVLPPTPQRSPYAPFLAYLATKLSNVPEENLPLVEREILNLVLQHSKE